MAESKVAGAGWMFAFTHEIRTYLRTVLTRIQLVQSSADAVVLPEGEQAMLQEAAAAARNIDGLLNAMVAFCEGSGEAGEENLRLLLRGLSIERKAALAEVGAELEVANAPDVPVPVGLKSVLKELIDNAVRFRSSERPLRIRIASGITAEGLEVAVSDNGIGMDPAYLEKIFAPFCRLNSREEFPGYGLGLATCRRMVEGWGGTISAELGVEPGLTVRVNIPLNE